MDAKIKALVTVYVSKRDVNGNCYYACTVIDTETGGSFTGTITAASNLQSALCQIYGFGSQAWRTNEQVMPIREFNRFVKNLPDLGCRPEDIAQKIREGLSLPISGRL